MEILNLVQGTPEWRAYRSDPSQCNASEASIIMGASKNVTRDELIAWKNDPSLRVTNEYLQEVIFPAGHEAEARARAAIEDENGIDLFPVVGRTTVRGQSMSASFDGRDVEGVKLFEHKQWSQTKAQHILDHNTVPPEDYWQVVQQLAVNDDADAILLYVLSDGGTENRLIVPVEYDDIGADIPRLVEGWRVFHANRLAAAGRPAAAPTAQVIGQAPDLLPVLRIKIRGEVVDSNLAEFEQVAMARIEAIKTELVTDQDFADAEQTVKWLKDGVEELKDGLERARAQAADIDALYRTAERIIDAMDARRLHLTKLVAAEKANRREAIELAARDKVRDAKMDIEATLDGVKLPFINDGIKEAMKGKRTIESLENAANTAAANAIMEYNLQANEVHKCLSILQGDEVGAYPGLFPDMMQLALKKADDLQAIVTARIVEHKAAQAKRAAELEAARAEAAAPQTREFAATPLHGPHGTIAYTADGQPANAPTAAPREPLSLRDINKIIDPFTIQGKTLDEAGLRIEGSRPARYDYARTTSYLAGLARAILEAVS